MTDITWMQVLALMIGSGGITSGAVAITMKLIDRNSITKRTLAVLSYGALSDKIEKLLDQDYATPEQRKELEEFWKVYKACLLYTSHLSAVLRPVDRLVTG